VAPDGRVAVPQGQREVIAIAEVAHRGDARPQCPPGVAPHPVKHGRVVPVQHLLHWIRGGVVRHHNSTPGTTAAAASGGDAGAGEDVRHAAVTQHPGPVSCVSGGLVQPGSRDTEMLIDSRQRHPASRPPRATATR
jgi:hypothetical protein